MAKLGLTVRADPPRKIDMAGREWGDPVDGLVLSIRQIAKEDPAELASLSIVVKNGGDTPHTISVPGWLFFYEIEMNAPLTPWGRESLKPERKAPPLVLTLGPGDATETELPLGSLYEIQRGGSYRVRVSTRLHEITLLRSNEIVIQ